MSNCKAFYNLDDSFFETKNCANTALEIAQQPELWNETMKILLENSQNIQTFIDHLGDLNNYRIILTGAGSSAFIGEALALFLAKSSALKCEAIHTTDIVSAPETVLFPDIPTVLISFARSGNSPESMGAVQYARKMVKNLYEAAIVCDGSSKLFNLTKENKKSLVLVMPEGSNDKGFAMTSSFSCMLLAGFVLLNNKKMDEIALDVKKLSENIEKESFSLSEKALKCAKTGFDRAVYLASGAFKGLAHEASLKMLELTNGEVNTSYNSPTGFRHGPKAVVKEKTMSFHFISSDPFSLKYDIDLLNEVYRQKNKNTVVAVCGENADADEVIKLAYSGYGFASELCIGISGLVFFQMLAMFKSLELGITTDNPSPGGQVNRVVKGVTIYSLEG